MVAVAAEPPGSFELLDSVRQAYAALDAYHDRGTFQVVTPDTGSRTFRFSTAIDPSGALLFRIAPQADPHAGRTLWTDDAGPHAYDPRLGQARRLPSLSAELSSSLGRGSYDALVVLDLLAGGGDTLGDPEGASVDGPEACRADGGEDVDGGEDMDGGEDVSDHGQCWLLTLSRMAGSLETLLWIDTQTLRIRRLEHTVYPIDLAFDGTTGPGTSTFRVDHTPVSGEHGPAHFTVPDATRWVEAWDFGTTTAEATDGTPTEDPSASPGFGFMDEITVEIHNVTVRVVDSFGEPLRDLRPDDLTLKIGRQEIPIHALDWVSSAAPEGFVSPEVRNPTGGRHYTLTPGAPPGRTVVFFVQTDFEPTRIQGHMRLLPLIDQMLDDLHPDDRVAVFTYDSHLKLWQDFTRDREATRGIFFDAIRPGGDPRPQRPFRGPSILRHFDVDDARGVAEPEKALTMAARALQHIPGPKDMIFVGWGLGIYRGGTVHMPPSYTDTVAALIDAEITVFVLDVSQADWHALEHGLRNVAAHTGGTYQSTLHYPSQATKRLSRTLTGHYVLSFDLSAHPDARGKLAIQADGRGARVLHRPLTFPLEKR